MRIICKIESITFDFCDFRAIDERIISGCSDSRTSHSICSIQFQSFGKSVFSSKIVQSVFVILLMSPFSFIKQLSMLMARRFITPIKMGSGCQFIIIIVFKILIIVFKFLELIYIICLIIKQFLKVVIKLFKLKLKILILF